MHFTMTNGSELRTCLATDFKPLDIGKILSTPSRRDPYNSANRRRHSRREERRRVMGSGVSRRTGRRLRLAASLAAVSVTTLAAPAHAAVDPIRYVVIVVQ